MIAQKKIVKISLSTLLLVIFLFGASLPCQAQDSIPVWQKTLESLMHDYSRHDAKGDMKELKLIDYSYYRTIDTDESKTEVIEKMYAPEAPMAFILKQVVDIDTTITLSPNEIDTVIIQNSYPQFEIKTIRSLLEERKLSRDSITSIKRHLQKNTPLGTESIELIWEYKGSLFHSIGIIDNIRPIIDPITANLFSGPKIEKRTVRNLKNESYKRRENESH